MPIDTTPPAPANGSILNRAFLVLIALLVAFVAYKLNETFFDERIHTYWEEYGRQSEDLDLEEKEQDLERRKLERWGGGYYYSKAIAGYFEEKGLAKKALVLMPPSDYFTANGMDYYVPEPAIFYYMTGLKTLWPNVNDNMNPHWYQNGIRPNWYVHAANGQMMIDSIQSPVQLDSLVKAFNQYKTRL
jgi:hypothetical protein